MQWISVGPNPKVAKAPSTEAKFSLNEFDCNLMQKKTKQNTLSPLATQYGLGKFYLPLPYEMLFKCSTFPQSGYPAIDSHAAAGHWLWPASSSLGWAMSLLERSHEAVNFLAEPFSPLTLMRAGVFTPFPLIGQRLTRHSLNYLLKRPGCLSLCGHSRVAHRSTVFKTVSSLSGNEKVISHGSLLSVLLKSFFFVLIQEISTGWIQTQDSMGTWTRMWHGCNIHLHHSALCSACF